MTRQGRQRQHVLYRHFDVAGRLIYVGISNHALRRLEQHSERSPWFDKIDRIDLQRYASRDAALWAEEHAIRTESPLFNRHHTAKALAWEWWWCLDACSECEPTIFNFHHPLRVSAYPDPFRFEYDCQKCGNRWATWIEPGLARVLAQDARDEVLALLDSA